MTTKTKNTYTKVQIVNVLLLIPSGPVFWYDILWSCDTVDYKIFAPLQEAYLLSIVNLKQSTESYQRSDLLDINIYPSDLTSRLSKTDNYMLMTYAYKYYEKLVALNTSKYDKLFVCFCMANARETININSLDEEYHIVYEDNPYSGYQYYDDRSEEIIEKGMLRIAKVSL